MRSATVLAIVIVSALTLVAVFPSVVPASDPAPDPSIPSFIEVGKRYSTIRNGLGVLTVTGVVGDGWVIADYKSLSHGGRDCWWHPATDVVICPGRDKSKSK